MSKQEFIVELRKRLKYLPKKECDEHVEFYSEMIDDRVEDGLGEEDAILAIGSIDDIANQIIAASGGKIKKPKEKRRLKAWEITLIAVGSPLWVSLLIVALALLLTLYTVLWSLVVTVWAVFVSFIGVGLSGVVSGFAMAMDGYAPVGVALIGAGLVLIGLSVFLFFGCKASTKGVAKISKKIILSIKKHLIRRGEA